MRVETSTSNGVTVVALIGDLESATSTQVQDDLTVLVPADGALLLDLGRMEYLSSAGLRVLLMVYRRARELGTRLGLARIPEDVRTVMAATGFLDAFHVADTVAEGVEALSR